MQTLRITLLALGLAACQEPADTATPPVALPDIQPTAAMVDALVDSSERWYSVSQLPRGQQVFAENCAVCHGDQAQGLVPEWKARLADGSFPPPPLNGTAHAWHHPLSVLLATINGGGVPLGGKMPAFGSVLSDADKLAAIAYFQQFWTDDIYGKWLQMGGTQ